MASRSALALVFATAQLVGGAAHAAVSPEEAARLGGDLTPLGAERAGNEAGTIPEWTGGLPVEPIDPELGHVDPFPEEEPRFVITADNYEQYRQELSAGLIAMFEQYPETYRIPVYPTHRSHANPEEIYEAVRANATRAELHGTDDLRGAARGPAFPIPDNGKEVIWNHKTRYIAEGADFTSNLAVSTQSGDYQLVLSRQRIRLDYNRANSPEELSDNRFLFFLGETLSPARLAGGVVLVHQYIDQTEDTNTGWLYFPGQRRVRRVPEFGYDTPMTNADGLATVDQVGMFNGPLDRYEWKLLGKKEMFIPYNSYRVISRKREPDDILERNHLNPEHLRFERHRVWVVEARLRSDASHVYHRRVFYVDEDSWNIVLGDLYDRRGDLWRVQVGHLFTLYDVPATVEGIQASYDLTAGRYIAAGITNDQPVPDYHWEGPRSFFRPQTLRRIGR